MDIFALVSANEIISWVFLYACETNSIFFPISKDIPLFFSLSILSFFAYFTLLLTIAYNFLSVSEVQPLGWIWAERSEARYALLGVVLHQFSPNRR